MRIILFLLILCSCSKPCIENYQLLETGVITPDETLVKYPDNTTDVYTLKVEGDEFTFLKNGSAIGFIAETNNQLIFQNAKGSFGGINLSETFNVSYSLDTLFLTKQSNQFVFYLNFIE